MKDADNLTFEYAFKYQALIMDMVIRLSSIRNTAGCYEGSTARWIEREITSLLKLLEDKK